MKTLKESILSSTNSGFKAHIKKWVNDTFDTEEHIEKFLKDNDLYLKPTEEKLLQKYIWNRVQMSFLDVTLVKKLEYPSTVIRLAHEIDKCAEYAVQLAYMHRNSYYIERRERYNYLCLILFYQDRILVLNRKETKDLIEKISPHFSKCDTAFIRTFNDPKNLGSQTYSIYRFEDMIKPFA